MLPNTRLYFARTALEKPDWETRFAALEILSKLADPSDIARVECCLTDPVAPVRVLALQTLAKLLAFESEAAIRNCLFYNDASDPYGSLDVRLAAHSALNCILSHTRQNQTPATFAGNY